MRVWLSGNPLSHLAAIGYLILWKMCDGSGGNSCDVSRSTDEEPWPSERRTGSGIFCCCCRWLNRRELDLRYQAQAKEKKEKTNEPAAGFKCSDKPRVLHLAPEYCPVLRWRLADHSSPHKRSFMTRQNDYKLRTLKHFFYKKKEGEL